MVSIWENSNVRMDKDLERQRCDNTNQEEVGECSGIPVSMYGCESWTVKKKGRRLRVLKCVVGDEW